MFRLIVDIAMGFTQSWQELTGQERLWQSLRDLEGASVCILPPATWDSDTDAAAALIDRNLTPNGRIILLGYSWGGGWRAPRLARALGARNRRVAHMILCDPVYRSPWLPTWLPLNPLSMLRLPTIAIPGNVDRVSWFYQRNDRPAGHQPVAEDANATTIGAGTKLPYGHAEIDDSLLYHERARAWIEQEVAAYWEPAA